MTNDQALAIAVLELQRKLKSIELGASMFGVADLVEQRLPITEAIKVLSAMITPPPTLGVSVAETIKSSERLG
jgi:hypothetical protein